MIFIVNYLSIRLSVYLDVIGDLGYTQDELGSMEEWYSADW